MQLGAAVATSGSKNVTSQTFTMNADENVLLPVNIAEYQRKMVLSIGLGAVKMKIKIAKFSRHLYHLDAFNKFFPRAPASWSRVGGAHDRSGHGVDTRAS